MCFHASELMKKDEVLEASNVGEFAEVYSSLKYFKCSGVKLQSLAPGSFIRRQKDCKNGA
ncbi:hypothetical protein EYF80_016981 [Liparis tanakae]|uniref:Uncharacterized protein n=1 Tax=Liparis tanakae TaxID=230148 RepID=A0A4Z2I4W7_9TELE|nr:hypothetical protein EYF80_016981 [Liparis tanakae]